MPNKLKLKFGSRRPIKAKKGPLDALRNRFPLFPLGRSTIKDLLTGSSLIHVCDIVDSHAVVEKMTIVRQDGKSQENHRIPCVMRIAGKWRLEWRYDHAAPYAFPNSPGSGNDWLDGAGLWGVLESLEREAKGDRDLDVFGEEAMSKLMVFFSPMSKRQISDAIYQAILDSAEEKNDESSEEESEIYNPTIYARSIDLVAQGSGPRPDYKVLVKYNINAPVLGFDVSAIVFEMEFSAPYDKVALGANPLWMRAPN